MFSAFFFPFVSCCLFISRPSDHAACPYRPDWPYVNRRWTLLGSLSLIIIFCAEWYIFLFVFFFQMTEMSDTMVLIGCVSPSGRGRVVGAFSRSHIITIIITIDCVHPSRFRDRKSPRNN